MIAIRSAIAVIAATTSGATTKPSWAAKRAARSIRSGSSLNEISGVAGVRIIPLARSSRPPYGSAKTLPGMDTAMALTVKSRRCRSPVRVSPNTTTGLRLSGAYASDR